VATSIIEGFGFSCSLSQVWITDCINQCMCCSSPFSGDI